jgi:MOSC domain-containing protein YiiM/ketosteroid isomerase-like protein
VNGSIVSVQVGRVAPLGPAGVPSGFVKRPVSGTVAVTPLGLLGDEQADLRIHGGPEKAVYLYPEEHYERWRALFPEHAAALVPGGFGENLTTRGLDEATICIGDVLIVGTARLQVTQPRQPCFKLGLRFDDPRLARAMISHGLSGWYARVLDPGTVEANAPIRLFDRPNPEWPVARLLPPRRPEGSIPIHPHGGTMLKPVDLVRSFYMRLGQGDVPALLELLASELEWTEAERFPYYGGTWRTPQAVVDGLLAPLGRDWSAFSATPERFIADGDQVVALGAYSGTHRHTHRSFTAAFAHVWRVRNGQLVGFIQHTDTAKVLEATPHTTLGD